MFKPVAAEVKAEILAKVKSGEGVVSLAQLYGISDKTIYNWLRTKAIGNVSLLEHSRLKHENQQLKEIIGVLTFELSKFKKKTR
jgi:transposase-like protein